MFNVLEELFAPGGKHTDEERRRTTLVVDETGDADPCAGPIDLSSGKVAIRPPRPAPSS